MAPRTLPSPLTTLSTLALQAPLLRLLRGEVERRVVEEVREYLTSSLPPSLQSSLLVQLVAAMEHRSPHLVLLLLLTPSLRELTLHLTAATREGGEVRVSEGDMAACLAVMEEQLAASRFASLEKVVVVDRSEDPDFQGDPINNMANTNSPPEVWGDVLPRLSSLSSLLSSLPSLTHLVLPFASDQLLANLSSCPALATFQNVYRSTVSAAGLGALARGAVRTSLVRLVLSLNSHAEVEEGAVREVLAAMPQLRVLELGGVGRTRSLYLQGGDALRRSAVHRALVEDGRVTALTRLLVFLRGDAPPALAPLPRLAPHLRDLTMFGWEHVVVEEQAWAGVAAGLVRLEVVGTGLATLPSTKFHTSLLAPATSLRELRVAGWGDTTIDITTLLATLLLLDSLYLEDCKLELTTSSSSSPSFTHSLSHLHIFYCATGNLELVNCLPSLLPSLTSLTVCSLYRSDPSRGLPFLFHLPSPGEGSPLPSADLALLATLPLLATLHLNLAYPARLLEHAFTLPSLLIRAFPALTSLTLDNFLPRAQDAHDYRFQRSRANRRLQWILAHNNLDVTIHVN